jgi:CRP-like cAMP-binding protein
MKQVIAPSLSVLDAIPASDFNRLRPYLKLYKVRKGKELFREGTFPKSVYIIKRGKVKLFQCDQNGSETIVHIHGPGEMLGYRPLLSGERYPISAETLEEGAVYVISAKHFMSVLRTSAGLSNLLLRVLSSEFSMLANKLGSFAQKSVRERTAMSLLLLKEKYRNPSSRGQTEITLSRHDLAAFVGTTIESIARILRRLREDKIIQTVGRKIIIRDEQALSRIAD